MIAAKAKLFIFIDCAGNLCGKCDFLDVNEQKPLCSLFRKDKESPSPILPWEHEQVTTKRIYPFTELTTDDDGNARRCQACYDSGVTEVINIDLC